MKQKYKFVVFATTAVLLALLAVNIVAAVNSEAVRSPTTCPTYSTENVKPKLIVATASPKADQPTNTDFLPLEVPTNLEVPTDIQKLQDQIPKTLADAQAKIHPYHCRFLMWTNDLCHIMWGTYGNGFFVGKDNLGIRSWGIYRQGVFAGFYDGIFFYGKYSNGFWKAVIPFEQTVFKGRYVLYPLKVVATLTAEPVIQATSIENEKTINQVRASQIGEVITPYTAIDETANIEELKALIPQTLDEAESLIVPIRNRFLLWTNDLRHVMWGVFGNGFFVGKDNLGIRSWGIYRQGVFAGFYDGNFFYGRYCRSSWKAHGLFGEATTYGRYVVAPVVILPTTSLR